MDEFDSLKLQELILLKELELVRIKLEYVGLKRTEQEKVISTPSLETSKVATSPVQTETGKDISTPLKAVVLLKSQIVGKNEFPEQQKVISSPYSEMKQDETNPEQTAPGKDSTNPLKAVNLPKIQTEVQTSSTLVKPSDLNLRPNGGILIPNKSSEKSLVRPNSPKDIQNPKNYYVVYNGPNSGIYNNWNIASLAVTGVSGVSHKKFKSFQEARVSADLYTTEVLKPPLKLINTADSIKPTYKQALKKTSTSSKKVVLGNVKTENLIIKFDEEDSGETIYDSFRYFYELGRTATEQEFVEHRFFTTDKANISTFNFFPNANPEIVYEAYVNGLVSLIYPSNNLLEISSFPKDFREAVKNFKKKCVKGSDKEIFIKVQSTLPFWEEYNDELLKPFHYVQLGIVKEKIYNPSSSMPVTVNKDDLQKIALHKYAVILEKIFSIKTNDKVKINHISALCIITSMTHTPMSKEDKATLDNCRESLVCGRKMFGCHFPSLCKDIIRILKKTGESDKLVCQFCQKEDPTTTERDKLSKAEGKATVED